MIGMSLVTGNRVGTSPGTTTMMFGDAVTPTSADIMATLAEMKSRERMSVILQGIATASVATIALIALVGAFCGRRREG